MSIPVNIHYEAQYAISGMATCKICGHKIPKGTRVLKVLGFRINHTIHPECITKLIEILSTATQKLGGVVTIRSSGEGLLKVGTYEKTDSGYRWKTLTQVNVKGDDNEPAKK